MFVECIHKLMNKRIGKFVRNVWVLPFGIFITPGSILREIISFLGIQRALPTGRLKCPSGRAEV